MLFFIMFLITFIKFFPTFVVSAIRYKLYKEKFEISYFSQFFSGQPIFVNVINFIYLAYSITHVVYTRLYAWILFQINKSETIST